MTYFCYSSSYSEGGESVGNLKVPIGKSKTFITLFAQNPKMCLKLLATRRHMRDYSTTYTLATYFPTDPFIVLEPYNPSNDEILVARKRESADFKAPK